MAKQIWDFERVESAMSRTNVLHVLGGRKFVNISWTLAMLVGVAGCNLCCPPYMDDYATIGGKWQRAHPSEGVVGSRLSDPGVVQASAENFSYREGFYSGGAYSGGEEWLSSSGAEFPMNHSSTHQDFSSQPYDSIILLDE